jgi:hypothetical protein
MSAGMNRLVLTGIGFVALAWRLAAAEWPVPPPFPHARLDVANGCLVESICFYDDFRDRFGADAWVRVLQWGAKEDDEVVAGHALAVFQLHEQLWTWDVNFGFHPLDVPPDQREEVDRIAPLVLVKYPRVTPRYPLYRFDFPQEPAAKPPEAQLLADDATFRDASLVAEKLARHRPVNLVQYSYVVEGESKTSAAAVFLFHGRFWIYCPELGTVPFLTRQNSLENLRLIQDCLRRLHPGAFAVKAL